MKIYLLFFKPSPHDEEFSDNFGGAYFTEADAHSAVQNEAGDREHCRIIYGSEELREFEHYIINETTIQGVRP